MPQSGIVKYHVKLSYDVDGLVERADIIGAIFGQTEGTVRSRDESERTATSFKSRTY